MPNNYWAFITAILGSGFFASVVTMFGGHFLQISRESAAEKRAAHASWVARQRELCKALMEIIIANHGWIQNLEGFHDGLTSRLSSRRVLQTMYNDVVNSLGRARAFRAELELEPNADFQKALDNYGDALIAYQKALQRPMLAAWNPISVYLGKTPASELVPLAKAYELRYQEMKTTIQAYASQFERRTPPKKSFLPTGTRNVLPMTTQRQEVKLQRVKLRHGRDIKR